MKTCLLLIAYHGLSINRAWKIPDFHKLIVRVLKIDPKNRNKKSNSN